MKGEIVNARITGTMLGFDDGKLTAYVYLDYGPHGSQAFGGWYIKNEYMEAFVVGVLKAVASPNWEALEGVACRVRQEHNHVHAIGHYMNDEWFDPEEAFEKMKAEAAS